MGTQLDIGRTLERVFAVYREQFAVLVAVAALVFIPAAVVQALLYEGLGYALLVTLLVTAIATIATYLYQGMVVEAVRDMEDGVRDFKVGGLARSVLPVLLTVIVASILAGIAITIGLFLLIVPGLILLTLWALIVPVIVIERADVFDAFGRSQRMVRGSALQVFAVFVVLVLIQLVIAFLVSLILIAALGLGVGSAIANLVVSVLLAPIIAIAVTVMYLELRRLHDESPAGGGTVAAGTQPEPTAEHRPAPTEPRPEGGPPATGPQSPPGGQPPAEGPPRPEGQPPRQGEPPQRP